VAENANYGLRNWSAAQFESSPPGHKTPLGLGTRSHCAISIFFLFASSAGLVERYCSVRGYGSQTYKPRQGRNAATVVCFALP
jgi:hypothetical protein